MIRNPIEAWTGGRGTGGTPFFEFENGVFRTLFDVANELRASFSDVARELVDWRLAEYLERPSLTADAGMVCRVSHAGGRPIIRLDREHEPSTREGWQSVEADGEIVELNFVKVAVNVARRPGSEQNILPDVLRKWFGPDAGAPGTRHAVTFEHTGERLLMKPMSARAQNDGPEAGVSYMRAAIPPLFGLEFGPSRWNQGFIYLDDTIFLLVTLEKAGKPSEHQYADRFLSRDLFEWASQNRHTQESNPGRTMRAHRERGIDVHLFVRKHSKVGSKAAPFIYCGTVDFVDWEGNQPITVRWRLRAPLSDRLAGLLLTGSSE